MGKREQSSGGCQIVTYFLACSKAKRKAPCAAEKMYQGAFFKKSLKWAKQQTASIYILSAKYGLLKLSDQIEPYELSIWDLNKNERQEWVKKVSLQMKKASILNPIIFLTPILYSAPFDGQNPLIGLCIGKRLKWINDKLKQSNKIGLNI